MSEKELLNISTSSATETVKFGKDFAVSLKGGEVILLFGDLGAGKTQLTKGIAEGLDIAEVVVSPTFTIERIYEGPSHTLHHFDLYRICDDKEIYEEIQDLSRDKKSITVIEWPNNLNNLESIATHKISLEYLNDNERKIEVEKC